jgi:hypothetical protein
VEGLCDRLGVQPVHAHPGHLRPGSWVENALRQVRVERWTPLWDAVGISMASAAEAESALDVMGEALKRSSDGLARGAVR